MYTSTDDPWSSLHCFAMWCEFIHPLWLISETYCMLGCSCSSLQNYTTHFAKALIWVNYICSSDSLSFHMHKSSQHSQFEWTYLKTSTTMGAHVAMTTANATSTNVDALSDKTNSTWQQFVRSWLSYPYDHERLCKSQVCAVESMSHVSYGILHLVCIIYSLS